MSWLLFMDESGHDHKSMPYEVRGGVAIQDNKVWPFVQAIMDLEQACFGVRLVEFKKEFKGAKLLDKDRIKWSKQEKLQSDEQRKRNARAFLSKGLQHQQQIRSEFTGYGQACYKMAQGIFRLLRDHNAKIFASAIPRGIKKPDHYKAESYLRKDHVYLLERFYHFVCKEQEQGLLILDQVEDQNDMRFVRQLERYFIKTTKGIQRSDWIVPVPLFSSSYLSVPIQVADVCIYCLNWCFRRPAWGMDEPVRDDIKEGFLGWIDKLKNKQDVIQPEGSPKYMSGIVFVKEPYKGNRIT